MNIVDQARHQFILNETREFVTKTLTILNNEIPDETTIKNVAEQIIENFKNVEGFSNALPY